MPMHYPGDRAQSYDHTTKTGLIGKVMGPDLDGAFMQCTDAVYDPEASTTTAEFQMLVHPERALERQG